jgi:hypothetical protein
MSTRCQIGFYEQSNDNFLKPDCLLYRHSDGYAGTVDGKEYGVLPDLVPFLKLFHKRRGLEDTEYAASWTLHHLIDLHITRHKEYAEHYSKTPIGNIDSEFLPNDGRNCIGYGISNGFHGDIEYYYAIQGNVLKVYKVKMNFDRPYNIDDFTLLETITIEKD